jgi:ubiquinone/menaquinone biosynthesis C-methylase UbiE
MAGQIGWPSEGVILEVGCGPGWLWSEAASQLPSGLRLTLTDLSAGMVDAAFNRVSGLFEMTAGSVADGSFDMAKEVGIFVARDPYQ